jgi:hypothetical protein
MSFSNAPDAETLGRVAGELAVDEAFIEKDWFVVQAINILLQQASEDLTPVFSGGTSLLKGHGLIKRFSEDIDFKLALSDAFRAKTGNQQRKALSTLKKQLEAALTDAGFTNLSVEAGSGNAFIKIEMDYPSALERSEGHESLRPHILVELSARPPRLAPKTCQLTSFVAQSTGDPPEVPAILCVDPVETGADKLSAFAWRLIVHERGSEKEDRTIIRHAHDLAALEAPLAAAAGFGALLQEVMIADSNRGGSAVAGLAPKDRLQAMIAKLEADGKYADDYRQFVEAMAFAALGDIPTFDEAVLAIRRLSTLLAD